MEAQDFAARDGAGRSVAGDGTEDSCAAEGDKRNVPHIPDRNTGERLE